MAGEVVGCYSTRERGKGDWQMPIKIVRVFLAALLLLLCLANPARALETFPSEAAAQQHCPSDRVVWLSLPTGIWHRKGARWYGRTKNGAYVCEAEAAKEHNRPARNGQ
jgi:hypothetical protein